MDLLASNDLLAPVASVLFGLSVLLLIWATLPAMQRRRTIVRHLRAAVALASAPGGTTALPLEYRAPKSLSWARFRGSGLEKLKARLTSLLPFILAPLAVYLATHQVLLAIAAVLQVWMFTSLLGQSSVAGRSAVLDAQMLPTVLRLTAAIRSGASLAQALEVVAEDAPSPTRDEFAKVLDEVSLGTSLDLALEHMANRLGTPDYMILSLVLTVQRRVGGNLPEVLDRIGDAVRERIEFRRQVAVLTSQQRMSTWILALLPFFIAGMFFLVDRSFMLPLVTTTSGHVVLLLASSLQLVGGWALAWAGKVSV